MILIDTITEDIVVKFPNNLEKGIPGDMEVSFRNTETKKEFKISQLEDRDTSPYYYEFVIDFSDCGLTKNELVGEWEYNVAGNTGLMRIGLEPGKVVYDEEITFRSYDA